MQPLGPSGVTYSMLERYAARLRAKQKKNGEPLSPATIAKKLRYVKAALRAAVKRRCASCTEFDNSLFPAVEDKAPRVLTGAEIKAVLDAIEARGGFRMRCLASVALETGGRRSELLSLTWKRVDFESARVHFTKTKSHQDRYVPLSNESVTALRKLQAQTLREGGPFAGMDHALTYAWAKMRKDTGVECCFHDLRRTCATRLIRAGVPLPTVQRWTGHKTMSTVLRFYTFVDDSDLRDAARKVATA